MGWISSGRKVCMFDLDGTLVDSMGAFADIAADVISRDYGMPYAEARANYLQTSGIPFFQQLEVLFPGRGENSRLAAEFERRKLGGFLEERYFPEVEEAIAWLRGHGIRTVVSSNNFEDNVVRFVGARSVVFDHVLGFREGFAKGRDHVEFVMRAEQVGPEAIVFVGDSIKDGERALADHVEFVGRTGTFSRSQFQEAFPGSAVVDSLSELKQLF